MVGLRIVFQRPFTLGNIKDMIYDMMNEERCCEDIRYMYKKLEEHYKIDSGLSESEKKLVSVAVKELDEDDYLFAPFDLETHSEHYRESKAENRFKIVKEIKLSWIIDNGTYKIVASKFYSGDFNGAVNDLYREIERILKEKAKEEGISVTKDKKFYGLFEELRHPVCDSKSIRLLFFSSKDCYRNIIEHEGYSLSKQSTLSAIVIGQDLILKIGKMKRRKK